MARKILQWYAGRAYLEDLLGDLDEVYEYQCTTSSKFKADLNYWKQVFSLLFSYGLKKRMRQSDYSNYYHKNSIAMFKNYFKIAIRNFSKHKLFTSLNIVGLALGMSICLLALSVSVAIYRSDDNQINKDRIFQINTQVFWNGEEKTFASTFYAVGDHVKDKYPFIDQVVKVESNFNPEVNHHGNLMDFRGYYGSEAFFKAFSFPFISGNRSDALSKPFSIVITKSVAEKLYKNEDPMGKTVETNLGTFTITGVIEDLKQTHMFFEVLASYSSIQKPDHQLASDWNHFRDNYVYVLLKEGIKKETLDEGLSQVAEKAETFHTDNKIALQSINLTQVVPRWNVSNALGIGWDQPSMLFFLFIGFLVLMPAVFNYTNLSIARALKRAKEIGIRKVVGAEKSQIKAQFIIETVLLSLLALGGSVLLFAPMQREFLGIIYAARVLDTSMGPALISVFIIFALLIGLFAGIFPAKFFSGLSPLNTLKGELNNSKINISGFKKGLFVFQFFVSLVFIIGVGTIARQYAYVLNTNHGFNTNNVLSIPLQGIDKQIAINELSNHPDVQDITTASSLPGVMVNDYEIVTPNEIDTLRVKRIFVGENFIDNLNIGLEWGNSESLQHSNQTEEMVIVNPEFIKASKVFNLQKDSLRFTLGDGTRCRIVGILSDMNFEPLSEEKEPIIMRQSIEKSTHALITVASTDIKKTIHQLDAIWTNIDQNIRFEARFLDDEIEEAYWFLLVQIKFFTYLSALAISISCLGLLGMVSYTTENRTKEIAVRKILGATNNSLYYLMTRDFVKLILVAAMIAIPFSYVFYDKLFLYFLIRYGLGLGVLEIIGGVGFLFLVGFLSIYWQTSKITRSNPSTKLRYE